MMITTKKQIAELINDFEAHPTKYDDSPLKALILERKNISDKEKKLVEDIKKVQLEIEEKMGGLTHEFTKVKGVVDYIETKIIELIDQLKKSE